MTSYVTICRDGKVAMAIRVLVLYNEAVLPPDHPDAAAEHSVQRTAHTVGATLSRAGYAVTYLAASGDPSAVVQGLRRHEPHVVFNLFEGTADQADNETYLAGLLQWLKIPFTGSSAEALALARNKPLCKHLLRGAGLPTAAFTVVDSFPLAACALPWPVIVKPGAQDGSIGLDQGSVVSDQAALERRAALLLKRYGPPVLLEQYIDGRELIVGLVEVPALQTLPVAEIRFADQGPGSWPIITYNAKWAPDTREYQATPPHYPADISAELAARVQQLARQAFLLLCCRDYARVDFRLGPDGEPLILEINPNPDFSPDAGLAAGLQARGLRHEDFTVQLVENALARGQQA